MNVTEVGWEGNENTAVPGFTRITLSSNPKPTGKSPPLSVSLQVIHESIIMPAESSIVTPRVGAEANTPSAGSSSKSTVWFGMPTMVSKSNSSPIRVTSPPGSGSSGFRIET